MTWGGGARTGVGRPGGAGAAKTYPAARLISTVQERCKETLLPRKKALRERRHLGGARDVAEGG